MELSEDFIKFMQIGLMVVGLLSIFLMFINYNVNIVRDETQREAYYLGDYLLGSKCLTLTDSNGNVIKSFFSESNLASATSTCINYPNGKFNVSLINCGTHIPCKWGLVLNPSLKGASANFTVAVLMNDGSIEPARMMVTV